MRPLIDQLLCLCLGKCERGKETESCLLEVLLADEPHIKFPAFSFLFLSEIKRLPWSRCPDYKGNPSIIKLISFERINSLAADLRAMLHRPQSEKNASLKFSKSCYGNGKGGCKIIMYASKQGTLSLCGEINDQI